MSQHETTDRPYWQQARDAATGCHALGATMGALAEKLEGYPGAVPVQAAAIQAAASYEIAAALNRIALALEARNE